MKRIIPLILSLALLAAGIVYLKKAEQKESAKVRALYQQVEPLERERSALQDELSKQEASYALKTRDYGTIEILFPNMNYQVYSEVYPIMREYDIVGVVGVSTKYLPGQYGSMKSDELNRLLSEGWGLCFIYESIWGEFEWWYNNTFQSYLTQYEVPRPKSVYFPNNSDYSPELDEMLINCGFETVILNSSDGRSGTVTDTTQPLWKTGAMPWNYTGFSTDVELIGRTNASNLCFVLDFKDYWDPVMAKWNNVDGTESKDKELFRQTLESWKNMIYIESPLDGLEKVDYIFDAEEARQQLIMESLTTDQQLRLARFRITNFEKAKEYHSSAVAGYQQLQDEQEQKKEEIKKRIAELDVEIRALYDAFNSAGESGVLLK